MNPTESDRSFCLNLVKENARDFYLADLLLPQDIRNEVVAVHAFHIEILNAAMRTTEPLAAEIRLQWWKEVLLRERDSEAVGNPVAKSLLHALEKHFLPADALIAKLEAHVFDLYCDPMEDRTMLEGYCGETRSSLFQIAALITGADRGEKSISAASGHAGVAVGIVWMLMNLQGHRQRQQLYLPTDLLSSAGLKSSDFLHGEPTSAHINAVIGMADLGMEHYNKSLEFLQTLRPEMKCTFAPVSTVPLYLKKIQSQPSDVFDGFRPPSQLKKQWYMWRF